MNDTDKRKLQHSLCNSLLTSVNRDKNDYAIVVITDFSFSFRERMMLSGVTMALDGAGGDAAVNQLVSSSHLRGQGQLKVSGRGGVNEWQCSNPGVAMVTIQESVRRVKKKRVVCVCVCVCDYDDWLAVSMSLE